MGAPSKEAHLRSMLKAVSYRLLASIATALIAFAFTRRFGLSLGIASVEAITKVIFYYLHERMWSFIKIGRKDHPLSPLPVNRPLEQKDMEEVRRKLKDLGYINDD